MELAFTPTVADGDTIHPVINAAVSSLDTTTSVQTNGISVSACKRRETSTKVEMHNRESFAIAGLLQDDFRDVDNQVLWLGDVPILSALFPSADYQRNWSELIFTMKPQLVNPVKGDTLALPTDHVRILTEGELFLFGKTAGKQQGAESEVARQDFSGAYGCSMK